MFDRVTAKNTGRDLLRRYLGVAVGADLLATIASLAPFSAPVATLGLTGFYLDYADQKRTKASNVLRGFNNAIKAIGLFFWTMLWMILWVTVPSAILFGIAWFSAGIGLVFGNGLAFLHGFPLIMAILALLWAFVVSIYKRVQYSFAFHVLAAHPELGVAESLRRSRELTSGCFWQILVMRLSFIGWAILSAITSGLAGLFWAIPYFNFTYAVAYRQLDPPPITGEIEPMPYTPRLRGMNGVYAGMEFSFNPGEILTLGRDETNCQIIFPATEEKISRIHCKVSYDANNHTYTVLDYHSRNGTLLADGTRLRPDVATALQRGTVILLGDSKNSFRLD